MTKYVPYTEPPPHDVQESPTPLPLLPTTHTNPRSVSCFVFLLQGCSSLFFIRCTPLHMDLISNSREGLPENFATEPSAQMRTALEEFLCSWIEERIDNTNTGCISLQFAGNLNTRWNTSYAFAALIGNGRGRLLQWLQTSMIAVRRLQAFRSCDGRHWYITSIARTVEDCQERLLLHSYDQIAIFSITADRLWTILLGGPEQGMDLYSIRQAWEEADDAPYTLPEAGDLKRLIQKVCIRDDRFTFVPDAVHGHGPLCGVLKRAANVGSHSNSGSCCIVPHHPFCGALEVGCICVEV